MHQQLLASYGAAPPPLSGVYWNPADKAVQITLDELDKLAILPAPSVSWHSIRSVIGRSSGKRYAECEYTSGVNWGVIGGLATASHSLDQFPGQNSASWGMQCQTSGSTGAAYHNGGQIGSIADIPMGGTIRIAVDLDAGQIWLGSASAYVGGGSPSAGTSPTATFSAGPTLFVCLGLFHQSIESSSRIRTLPGEFVETVPTGFTAWSS